VNWFDWNSPAVLPGCFRLEGKMAGTSVFAWDDVAAVADANADRRVIAGVAGDLKRVEVPAGTVADRHAHDFEQFFMVLEGTGVLTCADGEIALKPGVVIHFKPAAWHSAVFETRTVLVEVNFRKA
jgi:quercetin dioxygenase-like cupin family protein